MLQLKVIRPRVIISECPVTVTISECPVTVIISKCPVTVIISECPVTVIISVTVKALVPRNDIVYNRF